MEVRRHCECKVSIVLDLDEVGILSALIDFPAWRDQPKEVQTLCDGLWEGLSSALGEDADDVLKYAADIEMTPYTTVAD